ncbi:hypothetical protein EC957_010362 [Mortierella hygrophila]|uniref:Uncharacterized protein n=1 Tax=Mortierella hygrophila TaxID=979708 RepID=A0A9P6JXK7_9FUNG|nr:hypothetical protein EC957_010362 [Mortierella hygrophila]
MLYGLDDYEFDQDDDQDDKSENPVLHPEEILELALYYLSQHNFHQDEHLVQESLPTMLLQENKPPLTNLAEETTTTTAWTVPLTMISRTTPTAQTSLSHLNESWGLQSKEHTLRFARGFIRRHHQSLVSLHITRWKISVPKMNMLIRNYEEREGKVDEEQVEEGQVDEEQVEERQVAITTADSTSVLDFREIKGIHIDQVVLHTDRLSFRDQGLESIEFEPYTFFTRYAIFNSLQPFTWSFPTPRV